MWIFQACATAYMHPVYYVVKDDEVVDKWIPNRGWWPLVEKLPLSASEGASVYINHSGLLSKKRFGKIGEHFYIFAYLNLQMYFMQ